MVVDILIEHYGDDLSLGWAMAERHVSMAAALGASIGVDELFVRAATVCAARAERDAPESGAGSTTGWVRKEDGSAMAAWRRKASEMFHELATKIDEDVFSPYALFFILLPFAHEAHRNGNDDALRRVYGYAQWCHHQRRGSELPNAVAVAFYEHLFDNWGLREQIAPWLSPKVATDIWPLWQARLHADQVTALRALLPDDRANAPWRGLRREMGA